VSLTDATRRDISEAANAVLAEVERWSSDDWVTPCEVHGETSDGMRLAVHIANRCRTVTAALREEPHGTGIDTGKHAASQAIEPEPVAALAALKRARDEALEATAQLSDEDVERLHATDIDGESDALMATCGLIGHWTFHLPTLKQIQSGRSG
jgi:hypothetical protein